MMKITKKQRKKNNGMNAATERAFTVGHKTPIYHNLNEADPTMPSHFVKVMNGVPYVNASNFN